MSKNHQNPKVRKHTHDFDRSYLDNHLRPDHEKKNHRNRIVELRRLRYVLSRINEQKSILWVKHNNKKTATENHHFFNLSAQISVAQHSHTQCWPHLSEFFKICQNIILLWYTQKICFDMFFQWFGTFYDISSLFLEILWR